MSYQQKLSTAHPGYIIILIDQSGSMGEALGGHGSVSKADECAKAVNSTLNEIGLSCTHNGKVKNQCEISILGYGQDDRKVINAFLNKNLASKSIVTIEELRKNCWQINKEITREINSKGEPIDIEYDVPIWIEPMAENTTPMTEAFEEACNLAENWTKTHRLSFPPVVINISDGDPNDRDTAKIAAEKLTQTGTNDGNTLLLNVHISSGKGSKVVLPSSTRELPNNDKYARFMFDISSVLPPEMIKLANEIGIRCNPGAKGFMYNADAGDLVRMLDIGSGSLKGLSLISNK